MPASNIVLIMSDRHRADVMGGWDAAMRATTRPRAARSTSGCALETQE